MHIGIKLPNWGPLASSDCLSATSVAAEKRGFDSVWVSDHVVMPVEPTHRYPFSRDGKPPFDPSTPFQDPLVALAWVAAITNRVQLGTGVLVLPLRHPIHVAKQVATLDALSGGRVVLGVGSGWMQEEFELLDQDFTTRGRRTDEGIATMRACWGDDPVSLGDDRFGPVAMNPKPVRRDRVPVLIGGHSRAALARAARCGDGWYGSNVGPAAFEPLAAEVRRQVDTHRSGSRFRVGVKVPVSDPIDASRLEKEYTDAGADFMVFDINVERATASEVHGVIVQIADELSLDNRRNTDGAI